MNFEMVPNKENKPLDKDPLDRLVGDMTNDPDKYEYLTAWSLHEKYVRDLLKFNNPNENYSEEKIIDMTKNVMLYDKSLPLKSKDLLKNSELIEAIARLRKNPKYELFFSV